MDDAALREWEERLIDFRPISLLGRGGFADVILAKDREGALVAIKLGHERANWGRDSEEGIEAFGPVVPTAGADQFRAGPAIFNEHGVGYPSLGANEIDALLETEYRLLRASGIAALVRPLELISRDRRSLLVEEYVQGRSLRSVLGNGQPVASSVFLDLLTALDNLHARSRIRYHGDLKPEHVLITQQGRARLLDPAYRAPFTLPPQPLPSRPVAIGVTPEYNPFLLSGPAADLFALAVMLYEVLARRLPFPAEAVPWTWAGVVAWMPEMFAALEAFLRVPAPHELNPSAPVALSEAVMGALRTRGEGRDLVGRFRAALQTAPAQLYP